MFSYVFVSFLCDFKGKLKQKKKLILQSAAADMAKRGNGWTLFLLRDYYKQEKKRKDMID